MAGVVWTLRLLGALVFIPFAVDQLRNPQEWKGSIPKWAARFIPGWPEPFMQVHAVGNIVLGVWILSGLFLKWAAGVAVLWMITIVASMFLAGGGGWRIAIRDLGITLAMLALYLAS